MSEDTGIDPQIGVNQGNLQAFQTAHATSDINAGTGSIHHTLDQPGGAAAFEHDHGKFQSQNISMTDVVSGNPINIGAGGISRVDWKPLSQKLMWIEWRVKWGSTGRNPQSGSWYFNWTADFIRKNQLTPFNSVQPLHASYYSITGYYLGGLLTYRNNGFEFWWEWAWPQASASGEDPWWTNGLPYTPGGFVSIQLSSGDVMAASGVYRYVQI